MGGAGGGGGGAWETRVEKTNLIFLLFSLGLWTVLKVSIDRSLLLTTKRPPPRRKTFVHLISRAPSATPTPKCTNPFIRAVCPKTRRRFSIDRPFMCVCVCGKGFNFVTFLFSVFNGLGYLYGQGRAGRQSVYTETDLGKIRFHYKTNTRKTIVEKRSQTYFNVNRQNIRTKLTGFVFELWPLFYFYCYVLLSRH